MKAKRELLYENRNELVIILLIVVILFGPTQIPKLTKMFGKSIKGFKEGIGSEEENDNNKDNTNE